MLNKYDDLEEREGGADDLEYGFKDHVKEEIPDRSNDRFGGYPSSLDENSPKEDDPCLPIPAGKERQNSQSENPSPTMKNSENFYKSDVNERKYREEKFPENGNRHLMDYGGRKRGRSWENGIRNKLGLTHLGFLVGLVLLCLLLLFLLVIIVLGATWPKLPHWRQYPICIKSTCLRSSALMLSKLDRTKSPCDDFYEFACGEWIKKHSQPPPSRSRWGFAEEMDLKLSEMIRDVIAVLPHQSRTDSLTWKIRNFYDSCMSLDDLEKDNERPLLKIINKLGGWSVLRNFQVLSWEFSKTLVELYEEYNVEPFFTITVVADPRNATKNILKLSPSGLGLPGTSYYYREKSDPISSSYCRYMKDVASQLGATSLDANSFAEDMFYFERRIAEFTPPAKDWADLHKHQVHNLTTLKFLAPSVPLREILDAIYKSNVNDNTEILLPSTIYLSKISNIIATTDRGALNNYVIWNLVKKYLPYLNQNFQNIYSIHNRETTGASDRIERWEFCVKALQLFIDVGLAAQIEKSDSPAIWKENAQTVHGIFENVRQTVKESITKAPWIDLDLFKHFSNKLENVTIQVGLPEIFLNSTYLKEYYSKLYVEKNNFFQNILHGVSYLQEKRRRKYVSLKDEYEWMSLVASETKVTYLPSLNKIIIPQKLLHKPYFESGYPMPVLYGTLGVQISEVLVSSLFGISGLYATNGSLLPEKSLLVNLTLASTDYQTKCLVNLTVENDVATEIQANKTSLNTFITVSAVKQALKALKKATANSEHIHQAGLEEFDDESLFYLAYGQSLFTSKTPQELDRESTIEATLDGKQLLKIIRLQLKSFAEIFNCGSPKNACKYIL